MLIVTVVVVAVVVVVVVGLLVYRFVCSVFCLLVCR